MQRCTVMLATAKNVMYSIGGNTSGLAKRVGGSTADLARRVGPKRGILGLVALVAAVGGGIYLVRYLRARAEDEQDFTEGEEYTADVSRRARRHARAERKANHAQTTH